MHTFSRAQQAEFGKRSADKNGRTGNWKWPCYMNGKRGGNPNIYATAHKALAYRRALIRLGLVPPTHRLNGDRGWERWDGSDEHLRQRWTAPGCYASGEDCYHTRKEHPHTPPVLF